MLKAAGAAFLAAVAATELGLLNRILDTVSLSVDQWLICLVVSLLVLAVAEIKKLLRIRTTDAPMLAQTEAASAATSAG